MILLPIFVRSVKVNNQPAVARATRHSRGRVLDANTSPLVVVFAAAALITAGAVYKNKIAAIERHHDRMNPEIGEGGTKPPPTVLPPGANPVRAGIYVDRIIDLSVKEARWTWSYPGRRRYE